jgi:hypothetical protein
MSVSIASITRLVKSRCPSVIQSADLPPVGMPVVEAIARIQRDRFVKDKTIKEIVRDPKVWQQSGRNIAVGD